MSVSYDAKVTEICWPKYAIVQELRPLKRPEISPESPRPQTPPKTPPQTHTKKERRAKRAPASVCPEDLSIEERENIREWASSQEPPVDPSRLAPAWEAFRDWATSNDHRRVDWCATFRNALRKGWVFEASGPKGSGPNGRLTVSEHNQRAARQAFEEMTGRKLEAIEGGRGIE